MFYLPADSYCNRYPKISLFEICFTLHPRGFMIKLFCSFVIIVSGGSSSIHISFTHPLAHRCGYRLERKDIDHTMTETTEKMQFLILGNIPENVNLIYTKHTTDMYNIQIVYLLLINDYLHSCKTIGINEANKSTDVNRNDKEYENVTELSPHFNAL